MPACVLVNLAIPEPFLVTVTGTTCLRHGQRARRACDDCISGLTVTTRRCEPVATVAADQKTPERSFLDHGAVDREAVRVAAALREPTP